MDLGPPRPPKGDVVDVTKINIVPFLRRTQITLLNSVPKLSVEFFFFFACCLFFSFVFPFFCLHVAQVREPVVHHTSHPRMR